MKEMFDRFHKTKELRRKMVNGEIIGAWMQTKSSQVAEILGSGGFDYVAIDMEHGEATLGDVKDMFVSVDMAGSLPFIRCPNKKFGEMVRLLELGACGLIVPNVDCVDDVVFIRNNCFYPPRGHRGVGFNRSNVFGKHLEEAMIDSHRPVIVGMIESKKAVDNLEDILECGVLDSVLIGPYDLSASIGKTGLLKCNEMKELIGRIVETCMNNEVPVGMHVVSTNKDDLEKVRAQGMRFNVFGMDTLAIAECYSMKK